MAKAKKEAAAAAAPTTVQQGMVLYTDGGSRPNPGAAGWGGHGYIYAAEVPKKGSGCQTHILTKDGYIRKTDPTAATAVPITPISYIDAVGSFNHETTNNVAEIYATKRMLEHAAQFDLGRVEIFTDSRYTADGISKHVKKWAQNNWIKSDGEPVKNKEYWADILKAEKALTDRGTKVVVSWVKGHADHFGNEIADQYATTGVMRSNDIVYKRQSDVPLETVTITPADGYWKYDTDRHPMLSLRSLYFNTRKDSLIPGEYYLGDQGKELDLLGKRLSDGAYALVRLTEPDPVLEMLRAHHAGFDPYVDTLMRLSLSEVYNRDTHQSLLEYGRHAIVQTSFKSNSLSTETTSKRPLCEELAPARIAGRAVEAIEQMGRILDDYLQQRPGIVVTDITPILYEVATKTSKKGDVTTTTTLKSDYKVGFAAFSVDALYQAKDAVASAAVTLTLGIDILDRNSLKRLETMHPRVSLITWNESDSSFRYATIVEADDGVGIWSGWHSSLRFL